MTHAENRRSAVRKIRGVAYALTFNSSIAAVVFSRSMRGIGAFRKMLVGELHRFLPIARFRAQRAR
jgi:hypothetical protein